MPTLRELRKRSYLSQEGLAKEAHIPRESISRFENGRKKPSPKTIQALAKALRVDPRQIQFPKDRQADSASDPEETIAPLKERLELFRLVLDNGIRTLLPGLSEDQIRKLFGKKKMADYILKIGSENDSTPSE